MPPFMYSCWPTKCNIEEENYQNNENEDLTRPDIKTGEVKHISLLAHRMQSSKSLEHSFSDISKFDINSTRPVNITTKSTKPKGLRADFVHLYGVGVGLHSKNPTIDLHEEKEGFQIRSIQRSVSSVESVSSRGGHATDSTKTIVVAPSIDLDRKELIRMCDCIECYEERQLYHLLLANDPSVRIIYLTSEPVNEKVVGYYLGLSHRSNHFCSVHNKLTRVFMISVPSEQYIPLSDKILQDNKLVKFLKDLIHQTKASLPTDSAGLCVFTGSNSVDKLSHELDIKLLEASTDQLHFGTKQGSREIFAACGIPHPAGTPSADDDDLLTYGNRYREENADWAHNYRCIRSSRSLAIGISRQILIHGVRPRKWMVKLNQGFSGKGNASIDLQKFQDCHYSPPKVGEKDILDMAVMIENEFETIMKFEDPALTWHGDGKNDGFQKQIERLGVIAEAFLCGEVPTSPSIQAVIEPNNKEKGKVSIISTHEQLLIGQVYHGCINPASEQYRSQIMEMGLKVGQYMASYGVVGHFSCDFLASQKPDGSCELNAVEINLRQGGTTHPHANMALLCGGCICSDGVFRTNDNEVRCYIATDCEPIKPCSESHLINVIECKSDALARKIRWNKEERIGVVFHLFKFASKGRIGFTAIGRSSDESQDLFNATKEFLLHIS